MQTNKQTEKPGAPVGERAFTAQDAEALGYADGKRQYANGGDFTNGMTWEDNDDLNEAYDRGVNRAEAEAKGAVPKEGDVFYYGTLDGTVGISLLMSLGDAETASHQGECHEDAAHVARLTYIAEQLDTIGPDAIRQALRETGGWEAEELGDDLENRTRAVWIAAGDIVEAQKEAARNE